MAINLPTEGASLLKKKKKEAAAPFGENSDGALSFTLKSKKHNGGQKSEIPSSVPAGIIVKVCTRQDVISSTPPMKRGWFSQAGLTCEQQVCLGYSFKLPFSPLPSRLSPSFLYTPQLTIPLAAHSSAYQPLNKRLIKGSA